MTVPIGIALLFLMAVAPVLPWRKASGEVLTQRLFWPAWAGAITMALAVALGVRGLGTVLAFGLGGVRRRIRAPPGGAGHPPAGVARVRGTHQRRHDRPHRRGDRGGRDRHQRPLHQGGRGALRAGRDARGRRPRDHVPAHRRRRGEEPHRHQGERPDRRRRRCTAPALSQYAGFGSAHRHAVGADGAAGGRVPHRDPAARRGQRRPSRSA